MENKSIRIGAVTAILFFAILTWDVSGLDMTLASWFGDGQGFPLRNSWWLTYVLHDCIKNIAWLIALVLCGLVIWPIGIFRDVPFARRLQLAASVLLSSALIGVLKGVSHTSCPWDLHEFGGVARHLSHWQGWFQGDGGTGHCFPAGHATSGFAFLGGFFTFRHTHQRVAAAWLAVAIVAGLLLGGVQQLRGAHFMSHTLWTAWCCWTVVWLTDGWFAKTNSALHSEVA